MQISRANSRARWRRALYCWPTAEGKVDLGRTRTRTNTNPYDTKAIAVGRSGCACGAQKVRVYRGGVGRRGRRVALVCVCCQKGGGQAKFLACCNWSYRYITQRCRTLIHTPPGAHQARARYFTLLFPFESKQLSPPRLGASRRDFWVGVQ